MLEEMQLYKTSLSYFLVIWEKRLIVNYSSIILLLKIYNWKSCLTAQKSKMFKVQIFIRI